MSNPNANQTQQAKTPPAPQPGKPGKRSGGLWIGLILALALGAGYLFWQRSASKASPTPASSEVIEPVSQPAAEPTPEPQAEPATTPEPETASASEPELKEDAQPTPETGSLDVRANVKGATVYLDGKRVGEAPQTVKELKPGKYQVKVEKAGYKPFEQEVQLAAERRVLRARLTPLAATLRVKSNVAGAQVRLDGKSVGSTPLELKDVQPGSHELTVSADGYDTHTETLTLDFASGSQDVTVDLKKPSASAQLRESIGVKHKHRIPTRSCEGVLRATTGGIEYETDHEDRFSVSFSEIEKVEFKGKSLNLKIREGKSYSFAERNENSNALGAFHDRIRAAMDQMTQASR